MDKSKSPATKEYDLFTIKFGRLIIKAEEIRGKILDRVIFIEFILDLIILKYFCESTRKIELFQATLLNQEYISLESKIRTFNNLSFGDEWSTIVKKLRSNLGKIKDIRNHLAHRMIDNSEDAIAQGKLRLIYYKHGKIQHQEIEERFLENQLKILEVTKIDLLQLFSEGNFYRTSEIEIKIQ